ncbi:MAG TPA: CRISPR-associated endonuclease Cas1 [Candidatus Cybelea sp.]|jgi:CRISPR-associated endonuclease Cas1|nr:CRISPR-associated endonuclease Cas1 [Candidatus Cybelea sp.]
MQDQKFTLPFPPLQVRAGILVADGYGISLRVLYGKLRVEDGIGPHRRSLALDRTGSGFERLVLLGKSGTLTLESLAWLRAIGAGLIHLSADGHVLTHSVPYGYDGHPIRRAQALAIATGLDIDLARDLIHRKLDGQRANLARLRVADLRSFDAMREALDRAASIDEIRLCEAKAAAIYWHAWSGVPIRLRGRDLTRVPGKWTHYESRASSLTNGPRAATNPINALLNYVYALLESETRLALLAAGLDPTLGVLHADQRNRDSFALDAMEPIRPAVDAFVLDLLEERVLTSRDFVELPNGVCRVRAPLTHDLAITLPRWRQLVTPVVAHLAQRFRTALSCLREISARPLIDSRKGPRILTEVSETPDIPRTKRRSRAGTVVPILTSAQSPLSETPRKQTEKRPYAIKVYGTPRPEALLLTPIPCAACGEPVVKRRRRHCDACIPGMKVAQAGKAVVAARTALARQAAAGADPRRDPEVNRKRAVAIAEAHRRNREWKHEHGEQLRDEAWFRREVLSRLDGFSLKEMATATGLSLVACSRIRSGARVPHRRHWDALRRLLRAKR